MEFQDKELYDKLHKAGLLERMKTDEGFKLLQEVMDKAVNYWTDYFVFKVKPSDIGEVARVQSMLRIYKHEFFKNLNLIDLEGEEAYNRLQEQNNGSLSDTDNRD